MPRRRAYTVLELLVVLVIMGVLSALAAPRYAAFRDAAAVRSATAEVSRTLSGARQTAMLRRAPVAVRFDSAAGAVVVHSAGQPVIRHVLGLSYGVRFSANRDSLVYDPRGLGYGGSNLSIRIMRGKAVDTVVVSRLGRVRW